MTHPPLARLEAALASKGYVKFTNSEGHDLNIVGVRTGNYASNQFNDWVCVFYLTTTGWVYFAFPATTDPGLYWRRNPENVKGTAILKPGQYRGSHKVGTHKGYKALQQKGNVTVWRDNDKDDELDFGHNEDTGIFGINIHRASPSQASVQVDKWSAGCTVLADPDHFDFFMTLCDRAAAKHGNSFTYTLLEEADLYS